MRIFSDGGNVRSCSKREGGRTRSASGSCSSTLPSVTALPPPPTRLVGLRPQVTGRHGVATGALFFQALAHPWHQSAHSHQVCHELRKWLGLVHVALGEVADDALLQVDLELVALPDGLCR